MSVVRQTMMLVVLVTALLLVSVASSASERTNIQFIFDASLSMLSRIQGETRMEIAKDVMRELLLDLEDQPGLQIALRVYGSELTGVFGCRDSVLLQDFAPVNEAREPILAIVESLEPRGVTPIAYSLALAGEDFAERIGEQNIIVLITDGQESCHGDPCAISQELQQQGVIMTPFVVGFALPDRESEFVRCIGHYYAANDRHTLKAALTDILTTIAAPPTLDLGVWAQGQAITDRVRLRAVDAHGQETEITHLARQSPRSRVVELTEGQYTLTAFFAFGPETLVQSSESFSLQAGEITVVDIDFGPLLGDLTVVARAGGVDASGHVDIELRHQDSVFTTKWSGTPPQTTLPAATYDVIAMLRDDPERRAQTSTWIAADANTVVELELGALPAYLHVDLVYMGEDISSDFHIDVYRQERWQGPGMAGTPFSLPPGSIDLLVRSRSGVEVEKRLDDIVLPPGETTHIVIDMGSVLGTLRVQLDSDGIDVTEQGTVQVVGAGASGARRELQLPQRQGGKETLWPAGHVVATGFYQGRSSEPTELVVTAGQITEAVLPIPTQGLVRLVPRLGDSLAPAALIEAHLWQDDRYIAQLAADEHGLKLYVVPGDYRLEVTYLTSPEQHQVADGILVHSGAETIVDMEFLGSGELQVVTVSDSGPFTRVHYVEVLQDGNIITRLSRENRESHHWRGDLLAGRYDVRIVPTSLLRMDDVWLRAIDISAASRTEVEAQLPGIGRIELHISMEKEPFTNTGAPRVYQAGTTTSVVQLLRDRNVGDGVWARDFVVGSYDISVAPNIRGLETQWLRDVEVTSDHTTLLALDLATSGTLQLLVLADGEPFRDISAPRVFVPGESRQLAQLLSVGSRDNGLWARELPSGEYDIRVSSNVRGMDDVIVTGIILGAGATKEIVVEFPGSGTLQVQVLRDGQPLTAIGRINVYTPGVSRALGQLTRTGARADSLWDRDLVVGTYDIEVRTQDHGTHWVRDVAVNSGELTALVVTITD